MLLNPGTCAQGDHDACDGTPCECQCRHVMTFRRAQREAWANKQAKGFNVTDAPLEFCLLTEEIGEAFSAWRKQKDDFPGELADIAIFLVSIAEMTGVDLQEAVEAKLAQNAARTYRQLPNGTFVKAGA